MKLESNDFKHNGIIPDDFTCDGANKVPHLKWSAEPSGTKSFALTVIDPDAPRGEFIHWLIQDIPLKVHEIKSGGSSPIGSLQIENDFGDIDYGGPCPPDREHRYYFTIYALDVEHLDELTKEHFVSFVKKHALASAELMGRYNRRKNR